MPNRLRVPASSANLGPGFDALGLALGCYLDCEFEQSGELSITVTGRDSTHISTSAANLIWRTAVDVAREANVSLPPVRLRIHNDIPLGKGLGSSAAALVTGVILASRIAGLEWDRSRILQEAARIEGHPDNVAACVMGSVVASAIDLSGKARAVRLPVPSFVQVAVVVPDFPLPTHQARAVLPECYTRADAIFNVQRAALLIAALATGDSDSLPAALEDRMHQPYRECLVPGLSAILHLREPGLLGCTLSGAGPSVLVFYRQGSNHVCELVRQTFEQHGRSAEVMHPGIDQHGYQLSSE